MLEELIGAVVRTQTGSLRRKATGAAVEVAALGLLGVAALFALVGAFLWLSGRVETWFAALIVASMVLVIALGLMWRGRVP